MFEWLFDLGVLHRQLITGVVIILLINALFSIYFYIDSLNHRHMIVRGMDAYIPKRSRWKWFLYLVFSYTVLLMVVLQANGLRG